MYRAFRINSQDYYLSDIQRFLQLSVQSILEGIYNSKKEYCPLVVIPPSSPYPSPQPQITASLACLQTCLFLSFHINGIIENMVFCDWFLSLNISLQDSSVMQHVSVPHSLLLLNNLLPLFFIHSFFDGHSVCFQLLGIMTNTEINI